MKKKAKRYDEGGVLRDGYGNPVRSGSGDVVRTRFGGRKYDEDAPASMTESSDYSGRGAKSYGDDGMNVPHSSLTASRDEEEPRTLSRYMRSSPKEDVSSVEMTKEEVKVSKPKKAPSKRLSGGVDNQPVGRMSESSDYSGGRKSAPAAPKSKFSDTGKSGRLNAFLKSIPGNPFGMKKGGTVSSASKRADGIAQRGKTKGRIV